MFSRHVAWTRGAGCLDLATALSDGPPIAVDGDLRAVCIKERIEYLVCRKLTSFDLVSTIVPHEVDLHRVDQITAAVADGPHSPLAVTVAARLGEVLSVPVTVATAYHTREDETSAVARLAQLAEPHRGKITQKPIPADSATAIVDILTPTSLLVIGAPGGSWFQRQLYGPGHRLVVGAPGGAVLVRSQETKCFHKAEDPAAVAVGPDLTITDASRIIANPVVPVTDEGRLIGIVRQSTLSRSGNHRTVGDLMEPPIAVNATEPLSAASELAEFLDGAPIPIIDDNHTLIGVVRLP
ncbi:MAG: CBS domain-containing protein [Acidimicrobiia bacterium]